MSSPTVVLLAGPGRNARILFNALRKRLAIGSVVIEDSVPLADFLGRRLRRLGVAKVAGQIAFKALIVPFLKLTCRRRMREIEQLHHLSDEPIPRPRIRRVSSINDPLTVELVHAARPTAIVLSGTRLVSADLLAELDAPVVNIHAGITPLYRGAHGAYWALARNDAEHCGVTVHLVDQGIDTGGILAQARIFPTPRDSFVTYPLLQLAAGLPLLESAIAALSDGTATILDPPPGESRLWSHPTLFEYLEIRRSAGAK